MENSLKFVSVDPSLAHTALVFGVIKNDNLILEKYHQIDTEKSKEKTIRSSSDLVERCRTIFTNSQDWIKGFKPDVVLVEVPSGAQSYSGALSFAVTCYTIATILPTPIQVTPTEVKKLTVGTKTASKQEIINYVHKKYPGFLKTDKNGNPYKNMEHVADAVCIAEAGLKTSQFLQIKNLLKLN